MLPENNLVMPLLIPCVNALANLKNCLFSVDESTVLINAVFHAVKSNPNNTLLVAPALRAIPIAAAMAAANAVTKGACILSGKAATNPAKGNVFFSVGCVV